MQLHLTIDIRAVVVGCLVMLVAVGLVTPLALTLADGGEPGERSAAKALTLGTTFTYQGRLDTATGPANGMHDFQFRLYDDALATTQTAGTTVVARTLPVADGIFTADIDFGAVPFDGTQRYLEVRVKASGPGGFSIMDPLQPLTVTPQAIFAMKAGEAAVAGTAGSAPWTGISGVPATFQDNLDNDTLASLGCVEGKIAKFLSGGWSCADDNIGAPPLVYSAGTGLTLTANQFSVQFLGTGAVNGTAATAARSNHTHLGQKWTSSGVTGSIYGLEVEATIGGIQGRTTGGNYGVFGQGTIAGGTYGQATSGVGTTGQSQTGYGVLGTSTSNYGVHGISSTNWAIYGETFGANDAIVGKGGSGFAGILGLSRNGANTGWGGYFVGNLGVEGSYPSSSDVRLKHDIASVRDGLDAVRQLRPVQFAWNGDADGRMHMGFLAQDVQEVFPDLVVEGRNGMLMLEYTGIIPVLTKAIQEQQAQIEALTAPGWARTAPDEAPVTPAPRREASGRPAAALWAIAGAVGLLAVAIFSRGPVAARGANSDRSTQRPDAN